MTGQSVFRSASDRRADIQRQARAMGVDDAFVDLLVEEFYARVRAHPALGPIFQAAIGDAWAVHLAKMKDFWSSIALNSGRYSGKPVPAHQKLTGVTPAHFSVWLGLFFATLDDIAPTPAAARFFKERAERIAESLQLAMFGHPMLRTETVK